MEVLLQELKSIELEHRWWAPEVFLRLENKTLERKVRATLQKHGYITRLIAQGTTLDMMTFQNELHERTPLMIVSVLAVFLDTMFLQESLGIPISLQIVEWYRQQGWKFPKFQCEIKLESTIQAVITNVLGDE